MAKKIAIAVPAAIEKMQEGGRRVEACQHYDMATISAVSETS
jgi:hypothetical protein